MQKRLCQSIVALALVASPRASGQPDPKFERGKQGDVKDVKEVAWTAKGEAGLVATTGNARTTTITAGANVTRKDKDNKLDGVVTGTFARATTRVATDANGDGAISADELSTATATSAENASLKLRYDRYLTELNSLYVAALGAIDRPAGKQFQGGGQVGYSRSLYQSPDHQALAELGYDLSYLRLTAGDSTTIHSLRAFAGYKAKLTAETALESSLEALFNANTLTFGDRKASPFQDARVTATIGVTTSLSSKLSLSASFMAKLDNFPAPLAKIAWYLGKLDSSLPTSSPGAVLQVAGSQPRAGPSGEQRERDDREPHHAADQHREDDGAGEGRHATHPRCGREQRPIARPPRHPGRAARGRERRRGSPVCPREPRRAGHLADRARELGRGEPLGRVLGHAAQHEAAISAVESAAAEVRSLPLAAGTERVVRAFLAVKAERAAGSRILNRVFGVGKLDDRPIVRAAARRAQIAVAQVLADDSEPTPAVIQRAGIACSALEGIVRAAIDDDPDRLRDPAWIEQVVKLAIRAVLD